MHKLGLIANKGNLYIEYGAGRAGLSSHLAEKMRTQEGQPSSSFLLIDLDRRRNKLEKNFREDFLVFRERQDIADFDLKCFLSEKQLE